MWEDGRKMQLLQIHHDTGISHYFKLCVQASLIHTLSTAARWTPTQGSSKRWKNSWGKLMAVLLLAWAWGRTGIPESRSRTPPDLSLFLSRFRMFLTEGPHISHTDAWRSCCYNTASLTMVTGPAKPRVGLCTWHKNQVALILHFWLIFPSHILKPNGLNY